MEKAAAKLLNILKRRREYVRFWQWPDTKAKGLAVVEEFTASLVGCGGPSLYAPRHPVKPPPDIVAQDAQGRDVGIEVTQLAQQGDVRRHGNDHSVYRRWTAEEVIHEIGNRIRETGGKKFHGGPYADVLLLILTNEPQICYDDYAEALSARLFTMPQQLTEVYLLFSYDRVDSRYRCLALKTGH